MPMAAPTAPSTPAAGTLKDAKAPFFLGVLVEEELLPPVPEPVLLAPDCEAEEDPVGVADDEGYAAPKALTSNGCEVA
jgi:hypothetical protein